MTELLVEAIRQVPSLAVLVVLSVLFLKHLKHRDDVLSTIGDSCHVFQQSCLKELHEMQDRMRETIDRNTQQMARVETKLDELAEIERQRLTG